MKLQFVLALIAFLIPAGCVTNKQLYERQAEIETKLEQLSRDVQNIMAYETQREERIARTEKKMERIESTAQKNNSELSARLDNVEKNRMSPSPRSPSPDALYSQAEYYYKNGKYESAILEFQRFIDGYPDDNRVPVSYLKQGLSLISIGRKEEAKFFFRTLIDKYPNSEEAKVAKEKLKEAAG